jgi:hypothetical protein
VSNHHQSGEWAGDEILSVADVWEFILRLDSFWIKDKERPAECGAFFLQAPCHVNRPHKNPCLQAADAVIMILGMKEIVPDTLFFAGGGYSLRTRMPWIWQGRHSL